MLKPVVGCSLCTDVPPPSGKILSRFFLTGYRHAPSRPSTDERIKIFVTGNTESDTFCMEEYLEKYTIVV